MALIVERVDTWAAPIKDEAGALHEKLAGLAAAGVSLEFMVARRAPEKPGTGVVFITPIHGAAACRAARQLGFSRSKSLHTVRVEGRDRAGEGARITSTLAARGISLRGMSVASVGRKFIAHVAVDNTKDAGKVVRALKTL